MLLFMCGHKRGDEMSPKGRPTLDKRGKRFTLRLSEQTYKTLEDCSDKLEITKAEVIHKGIALVEK
jgi:hypothetical protein